MATQKDMTDASAPSPSRIAFERLPEVKRRTGLSRVTIYRRSRAGTFPAPVKIGSHVTAWVSHEIDNWLAARIAERDKVAA